MHEVLHLIGICSDSNTHLSLMSVFNDPQITKQASILIKHTCTKACCKTKSFLRRKEVNKEVSAS